MQLGLGIAQGSVLTRQIVLIGDERHWASLTEVFARAGLSGSPPQPAESLPNWLDRIAVLTPEERRRLETALSDHPGITEPRLVSPISNAAKILVIGGWSPVSRPELAPRDMTPHVMTRWMETRDFQRPPITAFKKFCSAVADPGATLSLPILQLVHGAPSTGKFAADAALVVVMGKPALRVSRHTALRHVAGLTLMIDVWDDEVFIEESRVRRGMLSKNLPCLSPVGPGILLVNGAGIDDDLEVSFCINGVVRQRFCMADLAYSISEVIAFCSSMGLETGDMLAFGARIALSNGEHPLDTPAMVAPGDVLEARAPGMGTLGAHVATGQGWD